jgi:magnesium and cobalt exporter, CNNM family
VPWPGWAPAVAMFLIGLFGAVHFTLMDHSVFSLDREAIADLARSQPRAARLLVKQRENLDRTWLTLLTGSMLFGLLLALAVVTLGLRLAGWADASSPPSGHLGISVAGALVFAVAVHMALAEGLPRMAAGRFLEAMAPFSAQALRVWSVVFFPLVLPPLLALRLVARIKNTNLSERFADLDIEKRLLTLISVGQVEVTLEEEEREMIDHALEFGETSASDIMTARGEIVGFDTSSTQEEALDIMRTAPRSRVLVYNGSRDEIVGVLLTKQILLNPKVDYHEQIRPPLFVEHDMDLVDLLALMRSKRTQMVVVLDEYGSTAGVASFDDLLGAIVGQMPGDDVDATHPMGAAEGSAS